MDKRMTETGALLGQVDRLHKEVRKIAEDMAILYNTEKSVDQKTRIIGRALIEQKKSVELVSAKQAELESQVSDCAEYAAQQMQALMPSVEDVIVSVSALRNTEDREDALLGSLGKLSKTQNAFMKSSIALAKKAEDDLNEVHNIVEEVRATLSTMNLTDQVSFMNERTVQIQKTMESYMESRQRMTTAMAEQTEKAREQVSEMKENMERQMASVDEIIRISTKCEEKTLAMCEKLEVLLAEKTVTPETDSMSLEDMFGTVEESTFLEEHSDDEAPEALFSIEPDETERNGDALNADTFEEPEQAGAPDSEADSEEDVFRDDPDIRIIQTGEIENPKKKGFFSRLFGR